MSGRKKISIWAALIVSVLFIGMFQSNLSYASVNIIEKGNFENMIWKLDSEGTLYFEGTGEFPAFQNGQIPWADHLTEIKKVVFLSRTVSGGDISNYFSGCQNLASVNMISNGITKMDSAFADCVSLTEVGGIPDSVVSMSSAFKNCKKLNQKITVPANVEIASGTFNGCKALTYTPDIQGEKITDMSYMLRGTAITAAPHISGKAEDLSYLFQDCESLKTPPSIPDGVKKMQHTFENCYEMLAAPSIPGSVETLSYAFHYCTSITSPPVLAPGQLKDMSGAFNGCFELLEAPVIPEGVTNLDHAFYECGELRKGPDIPASVTDMSYCMAYCPEVCGTMTIYTVITDKSHYYRFAGDTALYQENDNPAFLGGCGSGVRVNYVKNNKSYIASYLSYGWNAGSLANYGSFGGLSVGSMTNQSVASCTVKNLEPCTYNGKSQRPEPDVYFSSIKLKRLTDYTLTYENNLNSGTGLLTIHGKGDYTGTKTVCFTIRNASFTSVKGYDYTGIYDGKPHSVSVMCDEGAVVEYGTEPGQYTTKTCPEYTLPGTYVTYFQVTKPNYETVEGSAAVSIQERELTVESQGFSGDYDGNPHSIRVEAEEGAVVRYGVKQGEYTMTDSPAYVNAGSYTVYYQVSKTGCTVYTGKRMVIIRRKVLEEVLIPEAADIMYGQSLREAALSFSYNQYGTFSWETPDLVPEAGCHQQVLLFTPQDNPNYDFSRLEGYDEKEKTVRSYVMVNVTTPAVQPTPVPEPASGTAAPISDPVSEITTPAPAETMPVTTKAPDQTQTGDGDEKEEQKGDEIPKKETGGGQADSEAETQESGDSVDGTGEEAYLETVDLWTKLTLTQGKNVISAVKNKGRMQRPRKVKLKEIRCKKKRCLIRWKKVRGADGYQVVYSPKKLSPRSIRKKNVRKYKVTLRWKNYKRYYVRVRAYKQKGKNRIFGKWSKIYCVKRPNG